MANYKELIPFILRWEGGFAVVPGDRGGATNRGVTIATFRLVYGQDKTVSDLRRMTDAQWEHIFLSLFWNKFRGDEIQSQSVANACVDWAWNSGISLVIRRVQRLVGVKDDGVVGPVTLAAINSSDAKTLFTRIKRARVEFLEGIVRGVPSQKKFLKGWLNRVNELKFEDIEQ